jgi:hypothetical protein
VSVKKFFDLGRVVEIGARRGHCHTAV